MTRILYVTELTLPRLLLAALTGRETYVAGVEPLFPPLRGVLERLAAWAERRGRVRPLLELFPEYSHAIEQPATIYIYNIFEETEPWLRQRFALHDADTPLPDYGMAIRQATSKFPVPRYLPILLLDEAVRRFGKTNMQIAGVPADLAAQFEAYHGYDLPVRARPAPVWCAAANAVQWLAVTLAGLGWIASRLRPFGVRAEPFFFAADYIEDERDFRLYAEVEEGGPVLLVVRHAPRGVGTVPELAGYRHCRATDGRLGPRGALACAAMLLRDGWSLFRRHRATHPGLFFQIVVLPFRRAILRAFFTRFRPRYFWGRDDYNVEHILRRQEIHRIGGTSLGVIHGAPGVAILEPMWRHVSFDRYFLFGRAVYDSHWHETFAPDMEIVPIGTFGASREDYARIGERLPPDIIIFLSVFADSEKLPAIVHALARAFPERRVILSPKRTVMNLTSVKRILAACIGEHGNVAVETGETDLFERLRMARYAFSDASTTVIEALQFGLNSFFLDLSDRQRACYYRRYPALCVDDGNTAVQRIRDIEAGRQVYPRESFEGLVSLSGKVFFDAVREAVGLPAKEPAVPIEQRIAAHQADTREARSAG